MKKLKLNLTKKELTKQQMKEISGGYDPGFLDCVCEDGMHHWYNYHEGCENALYWCNEIYDGTCFFVQGC